MRRGLVKRENEISELLRSEDMDILFLTETDTKRSNLANYSLEGYATYLQKSVGDNCNVRILALVKDNIGLDFKLREDLMCNSFPSIWIEAEDKYSICKNIYNKTSTSTTKFLYLTEV